MEMEVIYNIGQTTAMAGLAGPPLLPLLPLLWYFVHSCSLPYVIYCFIFDLICYLVNLFYFYIISIVDDRWW